MEFNNFCKYDTKIENFLLPLGDYKVGDLVTFSCGVNLIYINSSGEYKYPFEKTFKIMEILNTIENRKYFFYELEKYRVTVKGTYCDHTMLSPEEQAMIKVIDYRNGNYAVKQVDA